MFDTSICKNKCLAYNIHMSLWVGCVSTEHSPATSAISSIRISLVPNKKLYTVSCLARPSECYIKTKSTRTSYMKSHVVVSRESVIDPSVGHYYGYLSLNSTNFRQRAVIERYRLG
ncbi:hypothetical protein RRG08_022355 [Elysia crispata]|uniref:Uncharacterized protein n=1 Tax=Elysia crispata TaxID=231223 RepID=A0AAE0Z316_9GAST|nr:hypothetical protein RRG08_022355 [Elysia crispata]